MGRRHDLVPTRNQHPLRSLKSLERGARALPHKLVITSTDEPSQPQYVATLRWDLQANPGASSFTFVPPKGAHRIELKPVASGN